MKKSHDRVQIAFLAPLDVRAAIQEIRLLRLRTEQPRFSASEVIEDAIRTLLKLEQEVAGAVQAAGGKVKPFPTEPPVPVIVSGQKPVPFQMPVFEKMPDIKIPNFTDEEIAALLKKVADGAP